MEELNLFVSESLADEFVNVMLTEKKAIQENGFFIFEDCPRGNYAKWWPEQPVRKDVRVKLVPFNPEEFDKNEKKSDHYPAKEEIFFLPVPSYSVKYFSVNYFSFCYVEGKIIVFYNSRIKPRAFSRAMLNSTISALVRWKEPRQKMGLRPWGAAPGQSLEALKALGFFLHPLTEGDLDETVRRINGNAKVVTAICLHADQERRRIVSELDPQKIKKVKELINSLPIDELEVVTFSPEDLPVLRSLGLQSLILPSIYNSADCEQQIKRHWDITRKMFEMVKPKVVMRKLSFVLNSISIKEVKKEAEKRVISMSDFILKNPPPIFCVLSKKEIQERIVKEATLMLSFTKKFAETYDFYLGLEVHAKYWKTGKLYKWGNYYLPTLWASPIYRQHWGW